MKNILIVGAGGIGSYLAQTLFDLNKSKQISNCTYFIMDSDTVETKNILYQNFDEEDILENKAVAISKKYPIFNPIDFRVESIDHLLTIGKPDLIISCVDNSSTRRLIFKYCYSDLVDFIDLRSEGKAIAFYLKKDYTFEEIIKTLPAQDTDSGSCQLEIDLNNGIIQLGNRIVANIGAQLFLNWYRNDLDLTQSNSLRF